MSIIIIETVFISLLYYAVICVIIIRILLRPHREPAARIAWISIVSMFPLVGILLYVLFGEVSVGGRLFGPHARQARVSRVDGADSVPDVPSERGQSEAGERPEGGYVLPTRYEAVFALGRSISGFDPVHGNSASIMANSDAMIDAMVSDIEAATDHVHILYYIWLPDRSGGKVADAVARAAGRGVTCRILVDGVGSRLLINSALWKHMGESGVELAVALPPFKYFSSRIDLRNHRKIVVIDGRITYCGSQNCADEEFLIKAKFAPWVDIVLRVEGPVVQQNQQLFANGWSNATGQGIDETAGQEAAERVPGFVAQAIGTGPVKRHFAMSQMFVALISSARTELTITTPYCVPDEPIQSALQAASYRGVKTRIVLPKNNDSYLAKRVGMSFYRDLLESGIGIHEFRGGLLHAKTLTVDSELAMVGSANLDRRSFDLNYENNIIILDSDLVSSLKNRQESYILNSDDITLDDVASWSLPAQLWNNALASFAPIL